MQGKDGSVPVAFGVAVAPKPPRMLVSYS